MAPQIPPQVGGVIFLILQLIVFAFIVIATPIAQFKPRWGSSACLTMWGYKEKCSSTTYNARGTDAFGCGRRRNNMNGAAAFALFSIVIALVVLIFAILMLLRKEVNRIVCICLMVLNIFTILVSWACVAGAYGEGMCGTKIKWGWKYGAGFGLLVTAWVIQCITLIWYVIIAFICK